MSKKRVVKKKNNINIWVILGILVVVALAVIVGLQGSNQSSTKIPLQVSVTQANQMRDDGAFILDVREPNEWEAGHIPGATLIPLGELESRLDEVPTDQSVVVVCRSGNRSATGRDILLNAGFTDVTSMAGGMNEWISKSFDVTIGQ